MEALIAQCCSAAEMERIRDDPVLFDIERSDESFQIFDTSLIYGEITVEGVWCLLRRIQHWRATPVTESSVHTPLSSGDSSVVLNSAELGRCPGGLVFVDIGSGKGVPVLAASMFATQCDNTATTAIPKSAAYTDSDTSVECVDAALASIGACGSKLRFEWCIGVELVPRLHRQAVRAAHLLQHSLITHNAHPKYNIHHANPCNVAFLCGDAMSDDDCRALIDRECKWPSYPMLAYWRSRTQQANSSSQCADDCSQCTDERSECTDERSGDVDGHAAVPQLSSNPFASVRVESDLHVWHTGYSATDIAPSTARAIPVWTDADVVLCNGTWFDDVFIKDLLQRALGGFDGSKGLRVGSFICLTSHDIDCGLYPRLRFVEKLPLANSWGHPVMAFIYNVVS